MPISDQRVSSASKRVERRAFRRTRNLWLAYASEAIAPLLRAAANARARGPATPPGSWRKGLIISHTHIGDVLYRTCSLPALKQALPGCQWSYLTSAASAEALANNPHLEEVLPFVSGEDSWNLERGGFARLASRSFDVVLCSNTLRHYPDLALATGLGIPNRVAFTGKGFSGLVNHPVNFRFPGTYASYFQAMVDAIGSIETVAFPLRPQIFPSGADILAADRHYSEMTFAEATPVLACSLTTRQASGNWPADVILEILRQARHSLEFDLVLCGSAEDRTYLESVARNLPFSTRILAGQLGLSGFAAFLRRCNALVTLDSGPRHIGNAAGIQVVFCRNLSHSKVEAGRYCETETDLAPDIEYLSSEEADRLTRALPVDAMARRLIETISASARRESSLRSG